MTVDRAVQLLNLDRSRALPALRSLVRRGWLKRLRRGLYLVLPLEAEADVSGVVEDPWLLAAQLFSPCYIGGWSAAEHWGLTEQIFRSTFVVSAAKIRQTENRIAEVEFHVVTVPARRVEGITPVWRGRERVLVSSPERTLVDGLITPAWLGGIRQLADLLASYRRSDSWKPEQLLKDLNAVGTGAAFKRLGYLLETLEVDEPVLLRAALSRRSAGIVKLDPSIRGRGRLRKRWGLWLNAEIQEEEAAE